MEPTSSAVTFRRIDEATYRKEVQVLDAFLLGSDESTVEQWKGPVQASSPGSRYAVPLFMFQPATIPEPIMMSLTLAKW